MNDFVIIISAPSGAGKTTIINRLLKLNTKIAFSISTTSREKRDIEIDGSDYYFISEQEFQSKINKGEFLEWARVHENYYGTTKKEIDRISSARKIPLLDIDVQGAIHLKDKISNGVYIFIVPPSVQELENRLRNRDTESDTQIRIRLNNSIKELQEFQNYDYLVINDFVDDAVNTLHAIITAEMHKTFRSKQIIDAMMEEKIDYTIR